MRWVVALGVVATGCGRIGFGPTGDGGSGASDSDSDSDSGPVPVARCTTTYATAVFCEDFELDLNKWFIDDNGANVVVRDPAFARSGSGSLHVRAVESGSARAITGPFGSRNSGTLYVRYYLWVTAASVFENTSLLHLVDSTSPYPGVILNAENNSELRVQATINGMLGTPVAAPLPRERWFCLQTQLMIAAAGSYTSMIDGVTAATYSGLTQVPTGYDDLHVGAFLVQTQPVELWIDDVVADINPIPCDRAP